MAAHDTKLLHDWDQTATQAALVHNIGTLIHNMAGRSRIRPKSIYDFHPYRKRERRGLRITTENFGVLRQIGNAMVQRG